MQATVSRPHSFARRFAQAQEQDMTSVLFQPFHLHDLTLPNRIVLAPLTRSRAGTARLPNRLMAEYYSPAPSSSAGLLITEATTISDEAQRLERDAEASTPTR